MFIIEIKTNFASNILKTEHCKTQRVITAIIFNILAGLLWFGCFDGLYHDWCNNVSSGVSVGSVLYCVDAVV